MTKRVLAVAACAIVLARAASALAVGETLLVPGTACGGVLSAFPHGGSSPVRLSGLATVTPGSAVTDAFYWVSPNDPSVSLGPNGGEFRFSRLSAGGCTCTMECAGQNSDIAAVLADPVPAFNPAHEYDVTLALGPAAPEPITFGLGDCGCSDNSGGLTVTFPCESNTDCDDGQDCTVDTCINAECLHRHDASRCGVDLSDVRGVAGTAEGGFVVGGAAGAVGLMSAGGIVRFTRDGKRDSTFGLGGEETAAITSDDAINALAVQSDGKIAAVGEALGLARGPSAGGYSLFTVARYDASGNLDGAFGENPLAVVSISAYAGGRAVLAQDDGKILALAFAPMGPSAGGVLVRYQADGTPDPTFGAAGIATVADFDGQSLARQPDGMIVVLSAHQGGGISLVRYDGSGMADLSFGSGGTVALSYFTDSEYSTPHPGFGVDPSGRLIVGSAVGGQHVHFQEDTDWIVVRFDGDGSPDPAFGNGGSARTAFGRVDGSITALAIQPDGKIVVAGSLDTFFGDPAQPALPAIVLARYDETGTPDATFGTAGVVRTKIPMAIAPAWVGIQPDGKIVVVGHNLAARYLADGSLDPTFTVTGPICGDGIVSSPTEECDQGADNGGVSCCTVDCHLRRQGEVCRAARSTLCDRDEVCDGLTPTCPADAFADPTTPCAIQDPCTVKDHCEGGVCVAGIRVCGATASQCLGCEKPHAKRLPRRIDVECKVDRHNLPGAQSGGFCDAMAFAPQATVSGTTIHCTGCSGGGSPGAVPAYQCHTLPPGAAACPASEIGGLEISKMERKRLKRDGTAIAHLPMSPLFRQALRKCGCLPVDVCTSIMLKKGTPIPLACELTVQSRAP